MSVVQYRLDARMLHGQTCAAWGKTLHVDEYVVINEKTANDSMQITLLQLAAMGTDVTICSPKDAKDIFDNHELQGSRTMVVFKDIEDVVEIVKLGYKFKELSVGSMIDEAGRGRKKYEVGLFCNEKDIEDFKYLESEGVKPILQIVPDYKARAIKDILKY